MTRSAAPAYADRRHVPSEGPGNNGNEPKVKSNKMASMNENRAICDDDDFEEDETLAERLIGLTEMFPESVRWACCKTANLTVNFTKTGWWLTRNFLWVATSSAVILALPVLFESERAQQQEEQLQQQRQILLGPNHAVSGGAGNNLLPGMGMVPPPPAQPGRKS